jgi:two-component system response regulator AtoC
MIRVLIADDDANLKKILVKALTDSGFDAAEADSGTKAVALLEQDEYDILLLDLHMPRVSGLDTLKKIKEANIPTEVIILTGNATVSTAVEAMKLGAYDYLTKPCKLGELKVIIEKAYEKKKLIRENILLKTQLQRQSAAGTIITNSPLMHDILNTITRIASSGYPVLLIGESGTGKELMAKAVHEASLHASGPFVPLNCGAIPESVMESELFGHEVGAFTGAQSRKPGLLELADKGTLFLDEIGEMPQPLQVKFLRVIETGKFFRVGGTREVSVNVKFIAATNKDLKREAEKGGFREDLYYRISALTIHIPPLRERKEDIPLLIEHCLKTNQLFKNKKFSPEAVQVLSAYHWPGNVRELQNVVHRALLLSQSDVIGPSDLPADMDAGRKDACYRLEDMEREHILRVLNKVGGHRGKAAEILGIAPKTLYNKLESYGTAD